MVHTMAWRQFNEYPKLITFSQITAARVSISDVIRNIPTLQPAFEGFLLKLNIPTCSREVFQRVASWPRDTAGVD